MAVLFVHRDQQFFVVPGVFHVLYHLLHGLHRIHVGEVTAQYPCLLQDILAQQQVFAAGSRCDHIDGRIDTFVGQFPVELQLHVARWR